MLNVGSNPTLATNSTTKKIWRDLKQIDSLKLSLKIFNSLGVEVLVKW